MRGYCCIDFEGSMLKQRKRKPTFVQEYAYIEDFTLYQPPKDKKESDENLRGVTEIDLNNGAIKNLQI